jgi:hypothetical protein
MHNSGRQSIVFATFRSENKQGLAIRLCITYSGDLAVKCHARSESGTIGNHQRRIEGTKGLPTTKFTVPSISPLYIKTQKGVIID